MLRSKLRRIAARESLGSVLGVFRARTNWAAKAVAFLPWPFAVAAVLINPGPGGVLANVAWVLIVTAACWGIYRLIASDCLAVCEGGLLLGAAGIPFVKPFRLRWEHLDPRTLAFVTPVSGALQLLGEGTSSSRRAMKWIDVGLSVAGPPIADAKLGSGMTFNDRPDASTGGVMWLFGCGSRQQPAIAEVLARALGPAVGTQLAAPIRLAEDPRVAAGQLPGYAPH